MPIIVLLHRRSGDFRKVMNLFIWQHTMQHRIHENSAIESTEPFAISVCFYFVFEKDHHFSTQKRPHQIPIATITKKINNHRYLSPWILGETWTSHTICTFEWSRIVLWPAESWLHILLVGFRNRNILISVLACERTKVEGKYNNNSRDLVFLPHLFRGICDRAGDGWWALRWGGSKCEHCWISEWRLGLPEYPPSRPNENYQMNSVSMQRPTMEYEE